MRTDSVAVPCNAQPASNTEFLTPHLALTERAAARGIAVRYIQPGKPNQNAFIERFNRTYRTEVLDAHLFANLQQVQAITEQWLIDYNEYRPHESLGGLPPVQLMPRLTLAPNLYPPLST
jgi:putative transposase